MSTPRKIRAIPKLMQHLIKSPRTWIKGFVRWVMRVLLLIGRQPQPQAGFVLPTTALLLLVVTLTVGAIGYRTYTRTQQTIGERQQQVIYNAATPAIDRARAKLEFLFDPLRDPRAGGVPSQRQLLGMMLNDGRNIAGSPGPQRFPSDPNAPDPYTLPGEERLDIDGDRLRDNAWKYPADTNGDGVTDATVLYSIIMTAPANNAAGVTPVNPLQDSRPRALQDRARTLQVRNAPLSNTNQANLACQRSNGGAAGLSLVNGDGWFPDPNNRTRLRKNFQVNAYVVPNSQNGTVSTLEFQQDREATQGFKWAAWFRNDLEIFPGASFNWNGAMHTEGSFILGGNNFRSFLVSSANSCIFDKSELTVARNLNSTNTETFAGQFILGITRDDTDNSSVKIDADLAQLNQTFDKNNDSVDRTRVSPQPSITDLTLEPVVLQTQDESRSRGASITNGNPQNAADTDWVDGIFNNSAQGRLIQSPQPTPYLDDIFRADNRLGPKPKVGRDRPLPVEQVIVGSTIGQDIPSDRQDLISADPPEGGANSEVGLDGYWERRARLEGLRLVVGQRLELGDAAGWGGPTDASGFSADGNPLGAGSEPLRPWPGGCSSAANRCNEQRQRRTLFDNLPAVQATAVYHANAPTGRDFPLACIATTVHPGTAGTLDRSSIFENLAAPLQGTSAIPGYSDQANPMVISDFFRGRGTNGWEFETPRLDEFTDSNSSLITALKNLANFAGDPNGGAPSFQPPATQVGRNEVHPYPSMAMWGDFSMLRRVLDIYRRLGYASLSPADKTTLHTAACTLGMLAYNVDYLEKLDYATLEAIPLPGSPTLRLLGSPLPAGVPAITVDNFSSLSNADIVTYFSGLRGRIRLINLMIDAGTEAAARTINDKVRTANPALNLALPDSVSGSRIFRDLALMTDSERQFMTAANRNSNPEFYVRLLERWRDDPGAGNVAARRVIQDQIYLAQLIITKEQVARDRQIGFYGAYGENTDAEGGNESERALADAPLGQCKAWNGTETTPKDALFNLCSYRPRYPILYSLFPAGTSNTNLTPAPTVAAALDGAGTDDFIPHPDYQGIAGSENDLYVRDSEDRSTRGTYISLQNSTVTYNVVRPENVALRPRRLPMPNASHTALGGALRDRSTGTIMAGQDWLLPTGAGVSDSVAGVTDGRTPNGNARNWIKVCSVSCSFPAESSNNANYPRLLQLTSSTGANNTPGAMFPLMFKDHAFFNGREMITVRTLDLDLDLMRNSQRSVGSDYWLPRSGIVYAFREDSVSEANIVRPANNRWSSCNTEARMQTTATCQMNTYADAYASTDPPLNAANRITPKPVDYLPDPDRRPYGFRLKQGISLVRGGSAANDNNLWRGISFVTANPAYILGDFNLHRTFDATPAALEEFTAPLDPNYGNFYQRGSGGANGTLDTNFAKSTTDQFRPSEVVADAVTILSSRFCDGSIQDAMTTAGQRGRGVEVEPASLQGRYGCRTRTTSFLNQNRPTVLPNADPPNTQKQARWVTANIADSYPLILRDLASGNNPDIGDSPLLISRSGMPIQWNANDGFREYRAADGFYRTSRQRALNEAPGETRINTIVVGGLVPTRSNQGYGGLHNFPRFIEWWKDKDLFFSGAFLQLNFSSYATAPFDLDAWEQGATPAQGAGCPQNDTSTEDICYYEAPDRRWGYDPALQYGPPAPVAERFQQPDSTRSEFYSEPPADDPYIARLSQCVAPNSCRPS